MELRRELCIRPLGIDGPMRDPGSLNKPSSYPIPDEKMLPAIGDTNVHYGLFFGPIARLNEAKVPAAGLVVQGFWSALLVLPRTYDVSTGKYGNLYSNLLDYVIAAALLFYVLTIIGVFRLRATRPDAERPHRAFDILPSGALRHRGVDHFAGALPLSPGDDVAGAGHRAAVPVISSGGAAADAGLETLCLLPTALPSAYCLLL
jgi:hypothetical protein